MASPRRKTTPRPALRRILLATDFSPYAEAALQWAVLLSRKFGARLMIFHALDLTIGGMAGLAPEIGPVPLSDDLISRLRAEAAAGMKQLAKRFPEARTVIREAPPRQAVLDAAVEVNADMIVMGTSGRSGLAHLLVGSVAEHVVRHSRIPVLTVRVAEPT